MADSCNDVAEGSFEVTAPSPFLLPIDAAWVRIFGFLPPEICRCYFTCTGSLARSCLMIPVSLKVLNMCIFKPASF